jgi:hypothetical protein
MVREVTGGSVARVIVRQPTQQVKLDQFNKPIVCRQLPQRLSRMIARTLDTEGHSSRPNN